MIANASRAEAMRSKICADVARDSPGIVRPKAISMMASRPQETSHAAESKTGRHMEGLMARITISPPSNNSAGTAVSEEATSGACDGASDAAVSDDDTKRFDGD